MSQVEPVPRQPDTPIVREGPRAREHIVRADYFVHRRMPDDLERARSNLAEALAIDPGSARAWAGLASVYWLLTVEGHMPAQQGLPKVRGSADRALALDPRLAEAHLRLAKYHWHTGDPRVAREHLAAATALEPKNPLGLSMSAGIAARNAQLGEAIELQRRAVESEPLSQVNRGNLIAFRMLANRLEETKVEMSRLRELNPDAPRLAASFARVLLLEGRFDTALELAEAMPEEFCDDPDFRHSPFLRPLHADPRWNE